MISDLIIKLYKLFCYWGGEFLVKVEMLYKTGLIPGGPRYYDDIT
jgi:hypothetical protein